MPGWDNFFVAQVGASAALAGLVFVGISINLSKIVKMPAVMDRVLEALIILTGVLVISGLMLVPNQPESTVSLELLGIGLLIWLILNYRQYRYWTTLGRNYLRYLPWRVGLVQVATVPFIVAGIVMRAQGPWGFYWVVPGIMFSYLVALMNAWIIMIEINR